MIDETLSFGHRDAGIVVTVRPEGIEVAGHVDLISTGVYFISWVELMETREQVWANLDAEVNRVWQYRERQ